MVKSSDITRDHQSVEQDRIRTVVHQHEEQRASLFKREVLPRLGIIGMLAGWALVTSLNNLFKDRR